jgi:hypothetical protein
MNSPAFGLRVASIVTGLISVAHLARLFRHFQILIGSHLVPMWLSVVAFVVFGLLSLWLCKLSRLAKAAAG